MVDLSMGICLAQEVLVGQTIILTKPSNGCGQSYSYSGFVCWLSRHGWVMNHSNGFYLQYQYVHVECACIYIYMYIYIYKHMMCVCARTHVIMYIYIKCVWLYDVYLYIYIYWIYTYVYIYTLNIYIYIYTHWIYTYIHILHIVYIYIIICRLRILPKLEKCNWYRPHTKQARPQTPDRPPFRQRQIRGFGAQHRTQSGSKQGSWWTPWNPLVIQRSYRKSPFYSYPLVN